MKHFWKRKRKEPEMRPGGPFLIQLLFKEAVLLPEQDVMSRVLEQHVGRVERFGDETMGGFAALEHLAEFKDGTVPVQLMILPCSTFEGFDEPTLCQMWDCVEERDRIVRECRYQIVATDMLAAALDTRERAELDMNFLDALAELFPSCEAFYFSSSGKLFLADDVRHHGIEGLDRFIRFGVNARFFNIQDTEDMLVDTVGMSTLFLPDLQYHFHGMDPNWVVNHAYHTASYLLAYDNPIQNGESIDGIRDGRISREVSWMCQYELALIRPEREVLDICMGPYASGNRKK